MKYVITLALLTFTLSTNAQSGLTNAGADIHITAGASLTLNGAGMHYTNNTANAVDGKIDNDGSLYFTGNWINNSPSGVFVNPNGTGTVILFENAEQVIGGTDVTNFEHVFIKKQGDQVILNQNTNILNTLDLSAGGVWLTSNTLNILNPDPNALFGVDGYLISEQIDNSGRVSRKTDNQPGTYQFLFGAPGGEQIPVTYNLTAGDAQEVTIATYGTSPDNLPLPEFPVDVFQLTDSDPTVDRFWYVGVAGNDAVADLTFTYRTGETPPAPYDDVSMIRARRYDEQTQVWEGVLPDQSAFAGTVEVPGVTQFDVWCLMNHKALLSGAPAVYPNPNIGELYLRTWGIPDEYVTVHLRDMAGSTVFLRRLKTSDYQFGEVMPIQPLAPAMYIITVTSENFEYFQKLIFL